MSGSREPDLSTPCARTRTPLALQRGGVQGVGKSGPHLVATLELTGERLALLAEEAATSRTKQKQRAIKMVAGARLPLYVLAPPPTLMALI